jgi:hypothetical protein
MGLSVEDAGVIEQPWNQEVGNDQRPSRAVHIESPFDNFD